MTQHKPHLAILGSGPTGLEAALAAVEHGYPFTLYEASAEVAGHIASWSQVRLFTPWKMSLSARMRQTLPDLDLLASTDPSCPTGEELIRQALQPISRWPPIREHLRLGMEVRHIGRRGLLKHEEIGSTVRAARPFRILVRDLSGSERIEEADVVLDCTGNSIPNHLGDGGIPAPGENELEGRIHRQIPDLTRQNRPWRDQTILLVGAGHSAQTALAELADLIDKFPQTRVIWALRGQAPSALTDPDDPLPQRTALVARAGQLAAEPPAGLEVRQGVVIDSLTPLSDGTNKIVVTLRGTEPLESLAVDKILSLTGRVGNHLLYRQLQVHECYATAGPMKLAAALMSAGAATGGDCLAQTSQGPQTLLNPEPNFFILGSKSYGRRNDYLMRVGWQQVDEVFHLLEN